MLTPWKPHMQTTETQVEVSAEMEHHLELLRQAYRLPTTTAVLELLISTQIDRSVYEMTGIKPGPKRTNEDGTPDKRQRVTPEKQKDHPDLKPHKHKKGE